MKIEELIPGFGELSAEEKLKALDGFNFTDPAELEKAKEDNKKLKDANTNTSAEVSKYKKELQARMTEDEQRKAESEETFKAMQEELAALKREKTVAEHRANFASVGYSAELAKSSAEALVDGNFTEVFKGMTTFLAEHDKAINAANVKKVSDPVSGAGNTSTVTAEQFKNMSYKERLKIATEDPELYAELKKE